MKLKNAVVGAKVQVKKHQNDSSHPFYDWNLGRVGTIFQVDPDGDVHVHFNDDEDDAEDFGHHSQVRLVKE